MDIHEGRSGIAQCQVVSKRVMLASRLRTCGKTVSETLKVTHCQPLSESETLSGVRTVSRGPFRPLASRHWPARCRYLRMHSERRINPAEAVARRRRPVGREFGRARGPRRACGSCGFGRRPGERRERRPAGRGGGGVDVLVADGFTKRARGRAQRTGRGPHPRRDDLVLICVLFDCCFRGLLERTPRPRPLSIRHRPE